jgi:hypothetical protein
MFETICLQVIFTLFWEHIVNIPPLRIPPTIMVKVSEIKFANIETLNVVSPLFQLYKTSENHHKSKNISVLLSTIKNKINSFFYLKISPN